MVVSFLPPMITCAVDAARGTCGGVMLCRYNFNQRVVVDETPPRSLARTAAAPKADQ
jgi:hypothetical protein